MNYEPPMADHRTETLHFDSGTIAQELPLATPTYLDDPPSTCGRCWFLKKHLAVGLFALQAHAPATPLPTSPTQKPPRYSSAPQLCPRGLTHMGTSAAYPGERPGNQRHRRISGIADRWVDEGPVHSWGYRPLFDDHSPFHKGRRPV